MSRLSAGQSASIVAPKYEISSEFLPPTYGDLDQISRFCQQYRKVVRAGGKPTVYHEGLYMEYMRAIGKVGCTQLSESCAETIKIKGRELTIGMAEILSQGRRSLPWLIRGHLLENSLSLIYGPYKQYKTFYTLDMALSLASGTPFLETFEVIKQGLVVYVAGEGHAGLSHRIMAWCKDRGLTEEEMNTLPLRCSTKAIQIGDGEAAGLARELKQREEKEGLPITCIIVDTLARNFGGADESRTQDMNNFIRQCDTHLREPFGAAVVIVHHTGHSNQGRARGSTALMASVDAQFKIYEKSGRVHCHPDFMKDAEVPPGHVLAKKSVAIDGTDSSGDPASSLVLKMTGEAASKPQEQFTADEKLALQCLSQEWRLYADWRSEFVALAGNVRLSPGGNKTGKYRCKATVRGAVRRAINSLERKELIEVCRCTEGKVEKLRLQGDAAVLQE